MVTWEVAKRFIHDASGIDNPKDWLWVSTNGVYYPVERIEDSGDECGAELKVVVGDRADLSYGEYNECPECGWNNS